MSHVMSVMIPWSYLSQVHETRSYVVFYVVMSSHAFGNCLYIALGVRGHAPLECDLPVLIKIQAASSPCSHRLGTQAHSDSQTEQLQRAGHEPVCLVPGSVDKYLPVPDCTLQKSLETHSEGL